MADPAALRHDGGGSAAPTWLFVVPWSIEHVGGVNQVVINLAREWSRSGRFRPLVWVMDWQARRPVWEEVHGLTVLRWRVRPLEAAPRLKARIAFMLWQRRFERQLRRLCDRHRVGVINLHYPVSAAFALAQIARRARPAIPLVVSFHGADLAAMARSPSADVQAWRQVLAQAQAVACSQSLRDRIAEVFGDALTAHVVHNGLDVPAFVALAEASPGAAANPEPGQRVILNVAKFEAKKGQDVLVHAFAGIAGDHADVVLWLVGARDRELGPLRELCAQRGIARRVRFFVDVPHAEMAALFRAASIFALPSRQEPFGIVLLEAAAFALPVVASRVGGIPEIVRDGVDARLVPPDDAAELAAALRSFLDAPDEARAMGERWYAHACERFTWTAAANTYASLLAPPGRALDDACAQAERRAP